MTIQSICLVFKRSMVALFLIVATANASHVAMQETSLPCMPISQGFGAFGPYKTAVDSIPHPAWKGHSVYFFHPESVEAKVPLILFCHGMGAEDPATYMQLIRYCVSLGYGVVYSAYAKYLVVSAPKKAYEVMWAGFDRAGDVWDKKLDVSYLGVIGHSFGGGAVPSITWKAITENVWGKKGCFMFIMAPWYVMNISQRQLENFPEQTKCIVETFDADRTNDPRMAIDLFANIGLPDSQKCYVRLESDTCDNYAMLADHDTPEGRYPFDWKVNALDYYGIYRLIHALGEYAFKNDSMARIISCGKGSEERYMGVWNTTGKPVRELYAGNVPDARYPEAMYKNFWSHALNARAKTSVVFSSKKSSGFSTTTTIGNYVKSSSYQRQLQNDDEKIEVARAESLEVKEKDSVSRVEDSLDGVEEKRCDAMPDSIKSIMKDSLDRWPISPILAGYGAPGRCKVQEQYYPNPKGGHGYLYCFMPLGISGKMPVVLFAPELQATGEKYRQLLAHIASRGCIVIASTYKYGLFIKDAERYDVLIQGFDAVIDIIKSQIDTTRIGFLGHSYGAGALPAISWEYCAQRKWGQKNAFLFLMSPSYVHCITQEQLEMFPQKMAMVIQVYQNDHWNDFRIAEDLFYAINIHPSQKDFLIVRELKRNRTTLNADYQLPICQESKDVTSMHYYALFRPIDALVSCCFFDDASAKKIALGNGSPQQVFMGTWCDGSRADTLTSTDMPLQHNRLWPRFISVSGMPAFFNWIWPFPYSCDFYDKRNERRDYPVP